MSDRIDVLHVDDDPAVLDLTAAFLDRELDDVRVTSIDDPDDALDVLDGATAEHTDEEKTPTRFDCVVSDYDMPAMNGLAFFEQLRAIDSAVPFVLYTGKGSEEIASQALNAGVTGYFQKGGPDQQRRLANRVRQAVEERRTRDVADRYSTVLRALGYPVYVVDETGVFQFVNEEFAEMVGYDREKIIGSRPGLMKDEETVAEAETRLGDVLSHEGSDVARFDMEVVTADGDRVPCRDHMAALPYEGDSFRGSVGILRNITDEQRQRAELETKRKAMDEAPVGITLTDPSQPDNPMVYVNDRFVEMTGYGREEAVGENCRFLQGRDTDPEAVAELRTAIEEGRPGTTVLRNYRKDGSEFWNRVSVAPLRDEDGTITNWVGFQEDVSKSKLREAVLERQNDRLDEFAGIVSHDLRNPLNVATGRLDLVAEALADDHSATEHLQPALDALGRMETIIDDTLTLAREGESVGEAEPVRLTEIATESWEGVETADAGLETVGDRTLQADPDRLRNLFENLFRNAIEHAGPETTVIVESTERGFAVSDDGPGILPEKRETVFQPGHSGSEGGTGFGLAIVREVAEAHGWSVAVDSSAAGGARFEVTGVDSTDGVADGPRTTESGAE
ncbi:hypothetical protein JCM17823_05530 [Halorubrum gandharaense]